MRWLHLGLRLVLLALTLLAVAWFGSVLQSADRAAEPQISLRSVAFDVLPGESREIGRRDLGQPLGNRSAENGHLRFVHRADGELYLQKTADTRRLDLFFAPRAGSVYSDRLAIPRATDGRAVVLLGASEITLRRIEEDRVEIETPAAGGGTRTVEVDGRGRIWVDGARVIRWCRSEPGAIGLLFRWPVWPLKKAGRQASDLFSKSARRIANLGGSETCRMESGLAQIALPGVDPEVELGLRRFYDGNLTQRFGPGEIRYFLFHTRLPTNIPVTYRTELNTGSTVTPDRFDRPFWPVTRATAASDRTVNGLTAGFTRYDIATERVSGTKAWRVTLSPIRKVPYFDAAACRGRVGVWPDGQDETEKQRTLSCPGPGRKENADLDFARYDMGGPIYRLMLGGRVRALTPGGEPVVYGAGATSPNEKRLYLLFSGAIMLMLLGVGLSRSRSRSWHGGVRRALLLLAMPLMVLPVWAMWTQGWPPASIAHYLFFANLVLFGFSAVVAFLDEEGGLLGQALQLVVYLLVFSGAVSLFTLSAEGGNSDWERFFIKHKAFVLDLLPALWMFFCSVSAVRLRNRFGDVIAGRKTWTSAFVLFPVLLFVVFLLWLFLGTQQGLLGFQPVELGKFVVLFGLGALLARWALRARLISGVRVPGVTVGAPVVVFLVALLVVPVLKSDYSPLIIIGFSFLGTAALVLFTTALRIAWERHDDIGALRRIPSRSFPDKRRAAMLTWWTAPLLTLVWAMAAVAAVWAVHDRFIAPSSWKYFDTPSAQMAAATSALGDGRRTVVERFLSWADMRYRETELERSALRSELERLWAANDEENARLKVEELEQIVRPRIENRGLAYQGIRSRVAIAYAHCGVSPVYAGFFDPYLHASDGTGLSKDTKTLQSLFICKPDAAVQAVEPSEVCTSRDLKRPVVPHCIPVVQSDFAGTFLMVRHGLGAGVVTVVVQILFAALGVAIFLALRRSQSREPVVSGALEAMATVTLGATLLFVAQWLLAWANTFVLLPIMGQPMTWTSAATSHHLFMALPAVLAVLIGARMVNTVGLTIPYRQHPAPVDNILEWRRKVVNLW
jgi:hypothetical protein